MRTTKQVAKAMAVAALDVMPLGNGDILIKALVAELREYQKEMAEMVENIDGGHDDIVYALRTLK